MTLRSDVQRRPKWSVQLIVDPADVRSLSPHLLAAFSPDVHGVTFGGGNTSEDDEPPWITIDVAAADWHEARVLAQHLVGRVYESAGLPPRELPVAWVAPLAPGDESSLRFMSQAKELLDDERYDFAVVAAQIHLEVHVDTLVRRAVAADSSPLAETVMRYWVPDLRLGRRPARRGGTAREGHQGEAHAGDARDDRLAADSAGHRQRGRGRRPPAVRTGAGHRLTGRLDPIIGISTTNSLRTSASPRELELGCSRRSQSGERRTSASALASA